MIFCPRENKAAGERVNAIFWRYLREKLDHFWPVNPYNGHKGRIVTYSEIFLSNWHSVTRVEFFIFIIAVNFLFVEKVEKSRGMTIYIDEYGTRCFCVMIGK
jgi:hypothetical protein